MNERRRLQRLPRLLLRQPHRRKLPQLVVHQRQELLRRLRITLLNLRQDLRNIRHVTKSKVQASAIPASPANLLRSNRLRPAMSVAQGASVSSAEAGSWLGAICVGSDTPRAPRAMSLKQV